MTAAIPSGNVRPQGFMAPRFIQRYVKPQGEERVEMKHRNGKPAVRRKADIDRSRKANFLTDKLIQSSRLKFVFGELLNGSTRDYWAFHHD
jgi:hypothetical protein